MLIFVIISVYSKRTYNLLPIHESYALLALSTPGHYDIMSSIKPEIHMITYHNAIRGGMNHGYRQHTGKIRRSFWTSSFWDMLAQTDANILIAIFCTNTGCKVIVKSA